MEQQALQYGFDIEFFPAIHHINGHTGCLLSHLAVIRLAKERKYLNVLILEDDALFIRPPGELPLFPSQWKMLGIGAILTKLKQNIGSEWVESSFLGGHAYILHRSIYDEILQEAPKGKWKNKGIDHFYSQIIHNRHKCYALYPSLVVQRGGFSDIIQNVYDVGHMQRYAPALLEYFERKRLDGGGSNGRAIDNERTLLELVDSFRNLIMRGENCRHLFTDLGWIAVVQVMDRIEKSFGGRNNYIFEYVS